MLRVYLAAPYGDRKLMLPIRDCINALGDFEVTASWLDEPDGLTYDTVTHEWLLEQAMVDLEEVRQCDILVVYPGSGAGHHTEYGMALAWDKSCVVVGKTNNIFHHLPDVVRVATTEEMLSAIKVFT